jgi:hypothetical protein
MIGDAISKKKLSGGGENGNTRSRGLLPRKSRVPDLFQTHAARRRARSWRAMKALTISMARSVWFRVFHPHILAAGKDLQLAFATSRAVRRGKFFLERRARCHPPRLAKKIAAICKALILRSATTPNPT